MKFFAALIGAMLCASQAFAEAPAIPPYFSFMTFPGLSASVQGSGMPGLDGGKWFIYNNPATFDTQPSLRVGRVVGTNSGNSTSAAGGNFQTLLVTSTNGSYNTGGEWTGLFSQHNSVIENGVSGGVAINGTIFKEQPTLSGATTGASGTGTTATVTFAGGATIPVGHSVKIANIAPSGYNGTVKVTASSPGSVSFASTATGSQTVAGTIGDITTAMVFASNFNCIDQNGETDPIGLCVGNETNVTLNAAAGTTDANRRRIIMQLIAHNMGGTGGHVGRGLLLGTGENVTIDRGVEFEGRYQIGLDFTGATFTGATIMLADSQNIAFDATAVGTYTRSLWHSSSGLTYTTVAGNVFFVDDNGNVKVGNAGHYTQTTNLPTISACGTSPPAASAGSSNNGGQITFGTGSPMTCTVTYASAFPTNAYPTVTPASAYAGTYYLSSVSKTGFTINLSVGTSGIAFNYTVFGN